MKGDVVAFVQRFFSERLLLKEMNHTFIRLVPKFQRAVEARQFWPISLCNVCYKIISKIMANRLVPIIDVSMILLPPQSKERLHLGEGLPKMSY